MKEMKIYKYKFDFHIFAFPGVLTICPRILDNCQAQTKLQLKLERS